MEFLIVISVFILFCFMLFKIATKSRPGKLPPGPRKLPIIGNMHQLIGPPVHRILADMAKKYGNLMHLQLGENSTVVVSSAEVLKEIMNRHGTIFDNRPNLLSANILFYNSTNIGFSPYGEYWRQLRKISSLELLSAKRVQTFQSVRGEEVLDMVKSISSQEGSVVNLKTMFSSLTYNITAKATFGKRSRQHEKFLSAMGDVIELLGGFNIAEMYPSVKILDKITGIRHKLKRTHEKVDEALENILDEHRTERSAESKVGSGETKEDLVDVLLNIQQSAGFGATLTDDNIKAVIFDIFFAGSEATSTTLMWSIAEMIRNPRVLERAQDEVREIYRDDDDVDESRLDELKYLQAVIKEAMRLHPAGPLVPRESSEECEIYGYNIPVKTRIMINLWAVMRDPEYWIEPEKFKPERFLDSGLDFRAQNFSYIPFGVGRRICAGISFALPTIQLALAQLLFHFDWKLPGGLKQEQLDMTEAPGFTVRPKQDLFLIPIPYTRPSSV